MSLGRWLHPVRQFGGIVSVLFTGAAASAGLSFLAQFLLTRRLPVTDFGRLAALLAVINFLIPMGSAGVNYFLLRALWTGRSRRGPLGASLHYLRFATALACIMLLAYASRWIRAGCRWAHDDDGCLYAILLGQIADRPRISQVPVGRSVSGCCRFGNV